MHGLVGGLKACIGGKRVACFIDFEHIWKVSERDELQSQGASRSRNSRTLPRLVVPSTSTPKAMKDFRVRIHSQSKRASVSAADEHTQLSHANGPVVGVADSHLRNFDRHRLDVEGNAGELAWLANLGRFAGLDLGLGAELLHDGMDLRIDFDLTVLPL